MHHDDAPPLEPTDSDLERMVELLGPFISESRKARIERTLELRTRELVVVLEDLYDDHNASAVLRTSEAFGVHEVHVIEQSSRFRISASTSLGAHKWLDVSKHAETRAVYAALKSRGYALWASSIHGDAVNIEAIDVNQKVALVFGNEHLGLSGTAVTEADGRFRVPMQGFVESLNVSVATAVSMYDVLSRMRASGRHLGLSGRERLALRAEWYGLSVRAAKEILAREGLVPLRPRRSRIERVSGARARPRK